METVDLVDYAYPTFQAERALKNMYAAVLRKNIAEARRESMKAVEHIIEVHAALLVMERSQNNLWNEGGNK